MRALVEGYHTELFEYCSLRCNKYSGDLRNQIPASSMRQVRNFCDVFDSRVMLAK